MSQWISAKGLANKYQIGEGEVEELVEKQLITSSRLERMLLIDEESFVSYLDHIKQIENKQAIIKRLNESDKLLEMELRACEETAASFGIEKQMLPLYPLVINALSMLVDKGKPRLIFYALAMGERLDVVAKRHKLEKDKVLLIYNEAVQKLSQDGESVIGQWMNRCVQLETLNAHYVKISNSKSPRAESREELESIIKQQKRRLGSLQSQLTQLIRERKTHLPHTLPQKAATEPDNWMENSLQAAQSFVGRLFGGKKRKKG